MNHWLVKVEPESYSWADLVKDGRTAWTGIRSYPARLHLRAMKKGDLVLYYHSVSEKQAVGIARVAKEAYADPTAEAGEDWSCVDIEAVKPLGRPVTLEEIKQDKAFASIQLVKQTRLSVMPLTDAEFQRFIKLSGTKI